MTTETELRAILLLFLALTLAPGLRAEPEPPVRYEASFDAADHHEAWITAVFPGAPGRALEVVMSRSSPGRYAVHEFAKNVYDLSAMDGAGQPLPLSRVAPNRWRVEEHDGTVALSYRVFGDHCDGTYLAVDNTHAHMNMPATFLWAPELAARPIVLTLRPPSSEWQVATQLEPTDDPYVFEAPNLYYFLDSPTELGPIELHEWTTSLGEETARMRLALHHLGTEAQGARFAELLEAVVREHAAMFGDLPDFEFGTYTFIADYLPWADGDGMEHRNSTILTSSRSIASPVSNLGTASHEFFHAWNVERLRPRSLEPFDFERANMSGELWFAEGFTSYYDDLAIARAGIIGPEQWARELTSDLNTVLLAPGRRFFSPIEMSRQAPFVDAAVSIDPTNRVNTFASYYPYGAVIALGLDLEMRSRFAGRSLDDFMRAAWTTLGATETPYVISDLESVLAEVTSESFAREVFGRFVRESDLPDYERLLAQAGYVLRLAKPDEVWTGAVVHEEGGKLRVSEATLAGSPLYEAGVDRGDVILEIGGLRMRRESDWREVVGRFRPGSRTNLVFEKRGGDRRRVEVVFQQNPEVEVVTFEMAGRPLTPEQEAFRASWLQSSTTREAIAAQTAR